MRNGGAFALELKTWISQKKNIIIDKERAKVRSCGAFVMERKPWYKRLDQNLNVFF